MFPLNTKDGKSQTIKAQYQNTSVVNIVKYHSTYGATGVADRIYDSNGKSVTLKAEGGGAGAKTGLYAMSEKPIYEVKDGLITIKGKQYPIKLQDGFYNIRKLTVKECMRLQTVPEWFEFPVSDSRAYQQLGNGWTCDVITHLIKCCLSEELEHEQLRLF